MKFITVNWKTNNGGTASTLIDESKVDIVLEKLNLKTKAWISDV